MNLKARHYVDLIIVLTHKEIKVKYKNSFLGFLWSIGHPLALAFVFFIAFKIVMKIQMEDFTLFLIAGLFPWQCFANSVGAAPGMFLGNASIIKKVSFPRDIIPVTIILQDMMHFLLSIPVIILFMFVYQKTPSISWLYGIPLLLGIQFILTYGVCLALSSINLFFRDLDRLSGIFLMLLFYVTPIFYPESMVPKGYSFLLIDMNPLSPLMISWRNLFLSGSIDFSLLMVSGAYSVLIFIIGHAVYRKLSWKFAEVL